jgi:hypothetical protein
VARVEKYNLSTPLVQESRPLAFHFTECDKKTILKGQPLELLGSYIQTEGQERVKINMSC